ncbi:MAG TPA: MDR family MFS transporter, partial [Cellulomonas sp.]
MPSRSSAGPSHREIVTILGGLMIGMFLAALDQTIVATSIRTIGDDLNGLSLQAWVTTAYLMTSTIATPLYGKLSDIYGRKPFYLGAVALFVLGSLLSGTADSMYQLAIYRGVQGLGAGGLMSLAITILGDLVPPRERARYQAYFLAVWGTSSVLGPVIGGFFAGADSILGIVGWRWVFLVNVPIGVIGLAVIWRVLHLPPVRRVEHRIDWPGALALVVALVPLLLVAEQGRSWGWGSGRAVACYLVGAVGVVAFLLAERRLGKDALLPLHLFRDRTFSTGAGANVVIGLGMFGGLATLPLYLQIVRGMSPTEAGLTLIPFTVGIMAGSILAGQLTSRTGRYKVFPVVGTLLMGVGALLFSRLSADTSLAEIFASSIVFGLGLGLTMQPLVLAVQNAVPVQDMGVATSSSLFFRQVGGTLGTAVFLSILFSTVG